MSPFTDSQMAAIDRAAERRAAAEDWATTKTTKRVLADLAEVREAFPLIEGRPAEPVAANRKAA